MKRKKNPVSAHLTRLLMPAAYVAAWKKALAHPKQVFSVNGHTQTGEEAARKFSQALMWRINSRGGLDKSRGRKDDADWERWMWSAARAINNPRLRVYESEVPFEIRKRFKKRFASRDD